MSREQGTIVLSGPPGVGKSALLRAMAQEKPLVPADLDDLVMHRSGCAPGTLIVEEGETSLRRHEMEALVALDPSVDVLALGGGTLTVPRARRLARSKGPVIGLVAPLRVLEERISESRVPRPLVAGRGTTQHALQELVESRRPTYDAVDVVLEATEDASELARRAFDAAAGLWVLECPVAAHRTRVLIGRGVAHALRGAIASIAPTRPVILVVDANVPEPFVESALERIAAVAKVEVIKVPGGEAAKEWSVLGDVLDRAVMAGGGRQGAVVGMGGGAVLDLAAMSAALLGRGTPLVFVPTTLLAQVDASIGGKCGLNVQGRRNAVGTFYPAAEVVCDLDLLASLDDAQWRCGLAEILKLGLIADPGLFEIAISDRARRRDLTEADVARALRRKSEIVAVDPYDVGQRRVLNLGHTLAHALEAASDFCVRHGDAVAIGISAVVRLGAERGWLASTVTDRILRGITSAGLPTFAPDDLLTKSAAFLAADKKSDTHRIALVTVQEVGKVAVMELLLDEIGAALLRCGGRT